MVARQEIVGNVILETKYNLINDTNATKILDPEPLSICETIFSGCGICLGITNLNITDVGACGEVDFSVNCLGFADGWDLGAFHLGQNCVVSTSFWLL